MLTYHNDEKLKAKYLRRVEKHRKADQIVQGYGYWSDGKGCAVGCTIHSDNHHDYEKLLGIPEVLAHLEDAIFEELPQAEARTWPSRFLQAIPVGVDLTLTHHKFLAWLLRSPLLTVTDLNRQIISEIAGLHDRAFSGEEISEKDWAAAAWSAAWSVESAARSARSTAWSAAESVESAWSAARSTARSTAESAWSAARSARSTARSTAWITMSEKFLEILSESK